MQFCTFCYVTIPDPTDVIGMSGVGAIFKLLFFLMQIHCKFSKREEDEAARVYAEFVESFKSEGTPGSKTFVRGGFIDPNRKHENDSQG